MEAYKFDITVPKNGDIQPEISGLADRKVEVLI